ncbi:DUF4339 domain-containing protein [Natranaerofaba carboxydovora]|uniref:DUF4339 domain-containing protein n=1 Tax=Natranaerofaba carboxydovora TaxID=2742683 RepID=UPI001F145205|nr:DUF4339 domain-containing protein [Natranaerofaba carboxydovora]UMZ73688.1 hypothetical protein ACONDI_01253 [Natranaerofaba carboxydovora]
MKSQNGEWIGKAEEFIAYFEQTGKKRGSLDVLPKSQKEIDFESEFELIDKKELDQDPDQLRLLESCLSVLADPEQVVQMHYNLADTTVSRSILAMSQEMPGLWVTLATTGDTQRVSFRTETELHHLISRVLSDDTTVRSTQIGCDLSTEAALAFLGILDQYRRAWIISLVRHLEPVTLFSLSDVKERLEEAAVEDFRWALPFTDKLLPIPVAEMSVCEDPRSSLLELIEKGLIEPVDEEATAFELTEAGKVLAEGEKQAASRMVLSKTCSTRNGELAHDVLLFTRSSFDLNLFLMSGAEASMSSLLPGDLELILDNIIFRSSSDAGPDVSPEVTSNDNHKAWYMIKDGEQLGEFSWQQLKQSVKEGELKKEDLVWNSDLPQWVEANTIENLF